MYRDNKEQYKPIVWLGVSVSSRFRWNCLPKIAISCRGILASSHDLDAFLFIMNLVVMYKC